MPSVVLGSVLKLALSLLRVRFTQQTPLTQTPYVLLIRLLGMMWSLCEPSLMQLDTIMSLLCYYLIALELCRMVFPKGYSERP